MNMALIAEIQGAQELNLIQNIHISPVWKMKLWLSNYYQSLPFMAETDPYYPSSSVFIDSVIIDFVTYKEVFTFEHCHGEKCTWYKETVDNGDVLYIHYENHNPPHRFFSLKSGVLLFFSNQVVKYKGSYTIPALQKTPAVNKKTDILEYKLMSFNSGNVTFSNADKHFDNLFKVFGYNLNVVLAEIERGVLKQYLDVFQFTIENYTISASEATFSVKDKRASLSRKVPDIVMQSTNSPGDRDQYIPGEVYPFFGNEEKTSPDAYGYCFRVPGVCLNTEQYFSSLWRHFKFSRTITSNLMDDDFILEAHIGKKWVRLPRSEAEYREIGYQGAYDPVYMPIFLGPYQHTYYSDVSEEMIQETWEEEGTVSIPVIWACDQSNQVWAERTMGGINEVRLSARFNPQSKVDDILFDLMKYYGEINIEEEMNIAEIRSELGILPEIGLYMGKEKELFAWVEAIQNVSLLGWQLDVQEGLFTARLDNPNRTESFRINWHEIINPTKLKIEMSGKNYATYSSVEYAYGEEDEAGHHVVDKTQRINMLETHKFDKEYKNSSRLANREDAMLKANVIMQIYKNNYPIIRSITLFGYKWFKLRTFDTGILELRMLSDRRMIQPIIRGKIMGINPNFDAGTVSVDIMQLERVGILPDEYNL